MSLSPPRLHLIYTLFSILRGNGASNQKIVDLAFFCHPDSLFSGNWFTQARSKHLHSGAAQLTYHVSEVRGANGASHGVGSRGGLKEALGFWPLLCV